MGRFGESPLLRLRVSRCNDFGVVIGGRGMQVILGGKSQDGARSAEIDLVWIEKGS